MSVIFCWLLRYIFFESYAGHFLHGTFFLEFFEDWYSPIYFYSDDISRDKTNHESVRVTCT